MAATRIEFDAVARALQEVHSVSKYGRRAISSNGQDLDVLLIQSGIGHKKAEATAHRILADSFWDVIISTGFAGDLQTDSIGSVLIGQEVIFDQSLASPSSSTPKIIACHPYWVQTALRVNSIGSVPLRTGRFCSVNRILTHSVEKQKLNVGTGAVAVDMESAAIGEVAETYEVPFLIIRTISDGAKEDLPVDFNLFLKPSGWFEGILHLVSTPSSWKAFFILYRNSKHASLELTRYFEKFFKAVTTLRTSTVPVTRNS